MAPAYVLDTNTVSYILAKDAMIAEKLEDAIVRDCTLYLCPVVYFEIMRGLAHRPAPTKRDGFRELSQRLTWDEFIRDDWDRAADLWADCARAGEPREDADILIAAYALTRGARMVTSDIGHFQGLTPHIENWKDL